MFKTLIEIAVHWPPMTAGFGTILVLFPRLVQNEIRAQR